MQSRLLQNKRVEFYISISNINSCGIQKTDILSTGYGILLRQISVHSFTILIKYYA